MGWLGLRESWRAVLEEDTLGKGREVWCFEGLHVIGMARTRVLK